MSRVVCLHLNVIAANYSKEGKKKEESSEGGREAAAHSPPANERAVDRENFHS